MGKLNVIILLICIVMLVIKVISVNNIIVIDGYQYDKNSTSITLYPKTNDFINKIENFKKLKELSIHPFKYDIEIYGSKCNEQQVQEILDKYTDVNDLSFLKCYSNIEYLNICGCRVENIEFVSEMNNLETLIIKDTLIKDISVIVNLEKLRYFDISNCSIHNYEFLLQCPELKILYISNNQLNDEIENELYSKGVNIVVNEEVAE